MQDPYYERDWFMGGSKATAFEGDASISAFRVKNGKASFKQRYVLTERLLAERKAGRALFGIAKAPFTHHPCVQALVDGAPNTNVIVHAGKLLALGEGGAPYDLDPNTMATGGYDPFPGQLPYRKPYTAHPHVNPKTGELVGFGYNLKGVESPDCTVTVLDKYGKQIFQREVEMPLPGLIHDCAITDNYIVLMQMPFIADCKGLEEPGGHIWTYHESVPSWWGLVPRDQSKSVRWFKWNNAMATHTGASWEENGKVYFDTVLASANTLTFLPTKKLPNKPKENEEVSVVYAKFQIDPEAETDTLEDPETLVDVPCEFPRIDERFLTEKNRVTFLACFRPESTLDPSLVFQGLNVLARYDYKTKKLEMFSPGPGCLVQEPCFSPRSPNAAEGDGFLITMIDNIPEGRNEVIIQDTRDFQKS
ncbi:Carotenoid oxygenase [Neofusicoccum parvum]|uniref:Carotenoid oxygenase n=1 Tax=Neofusicoccum parvum TaxID=310453 RepID=A0ACB5S6F6_9PEZI|nr:Carotenoid oxygenase [Neofusicoccum parvum]